MRTVKDSLTASPAGCGKTIVDLINETDQINQIDPITVFVRWHPVRVATTSECTQLKSCL